MATLEVNADEWDAISQDQQARIKQILVDCRLIDPTDMIIGVPGAPKFNQMSITISESLCKAACTAAQSLATAACSLLPTPLEVAACIAAAAAAGEYCRSKCAALRPTPTTP